MRYCASEKLEIIKLVEGSHLSARQTLSRFGLLRTTFYRWYDCYLMRGEAGVCTTGLQSPPMFGTVSPKILRKIVKMAFKETELSPRDLAVMVTGTEHYFVSESSAYRVLKAHDLITILAFIVIKAASEFKYKTTAINQLGQTDVI